MSSSMLLDFKTLFKKVKCRWKRIRLRVKGKPDPELYQVRKEGLSILEKLAENQDIDLFYGDETRFSEQGYVPYGWQFDDEEVAIEVCRGESLNCFGIVSRDNKFMSKTTTSTINSDFVIEFLDKLSFLILQSLYWIMQGFTLLKKSRNY